jgi:hypothetical protein
MRGLNMLAGVPSPHPPPPPTFTPHDNITCIPFLILYCFYFNEIDGALMDNCIISSTSYICHLFLAQLLLWILCFPTLCSLIYLGKQDHAWKQQHFQFHLYLSFGCSGKQFHPNIKKHFLNYSLIWVWTSLLCRFGGFITVVIHIVVFWIIMSS